MKRVDSYGTGPPSFMRDRAAKYSGTACITIFPLYQKHSMIEAGGDLGVKGQKFQPWSGAPGLWTAAYGAAAKVDHCLASFPPCDGFGNLVLRQ
jgi:hypothetical protein